MFSTQHIKTKMPSWKLDHKYLGPFQIAKIISSTAVQLILLQKWTIHLSFHISEKEPFVPGNCPVLEFTKVLQEVSDIEADEEYDVDKVKGSITRRNRVLYHIKWLGYPKKQDWTFEKYENFSEGGPEKLYHFLINHPNQTKDSRITG